MGANKARLSPKKGQVAISIPTMNLCDLSNELIIHLTQYVNPIRHSPSMLSKSQILRGGNANPLARSSHRSNSLKVCVATIRESSSSRLFDQLLQVHTRYWWCLALCWRRRRRQRHPIQVRFRDWFDAYSSSVFSASIPFHNNDQMHKPKKCVSKLSFRSFGQTGLESGRASSL